MNFQEWIKNFWPVIAALLGMLAVGVQTRADVDSLEAARSRTEDTIKDIPVIKYQVEELKRSTEKIAESQEKAMEISRRTSLAVDSVLEILKRKQ